MATIARPQLFEMPKALGRMDLILLKIVAIVNINKDRKSTRLNSSHQ